MSLADERGKMAVKTGMTWRRGKREVNIHWVKDGEVGYGLYDDEAHDAPEHCIGLYRCSVDEFSTLLASHASILLAAAERSILGGL